MARAKKKMLALDIGTRSIVGVYLEKEKDIIIHAVDSLEHEARIMFDGQIHDVEAVAEEIALVKSRLEEKIGTNLKQAAVAAAGRALKTARGQAYSSRPLSEEIRAEEVQALELDAVQQAQLKIAQEENNRASSGYFCVGYSVITYHLEEQPLQNLVGQVGKNIAVEVIATFLPRVVVDSLFSALRKANLEIASLTLEPIAALSAAIPANMRMLNLALVDIGAGTSDIAVVNKGNIFAYAMVPMGGDAVTESIAEQYLLDFYTAEAIKCCLNTSEEVTFSDILENEMTCPSAEIKEGIKPVVCELANRIALEIITINQKKPDAVICVGGGSMTPTLLSELAAALELPANRVGVRTREALANVKGDFADLTGPKAITPIGIGINALTSRPLPLVRVRVNDRDLPLWGLSELTVGSALLAAGINIHNIYGRPGMGLTIEVNGTIRSFKGKMGLPPVIQVNGVHAGLDAPVKEGDRIEFERGQDGEDARITIREIVQDVDLDATVTVNGQVVGMPPLVLVNGEPTGIDEVIIDRSVLEFMGGPRLSIVLERAGLEPEQIKSRRYSYTVNGEKASFHWMPWQGKVNGIKAGTDTPVPPDALVEYQLMGPGPTLAEVLKLTDMEKTMTVTVNGQKKVLPLGQISVQMNNEDVKLSHILEDESDILVKVHLRDYIFSDIFPHIDMNPRNSGRLIMKLNGDLAGFTTPLKEGDQLEILWDDTPLL